MRRLSTALAILSALSLTAHAQSPRRDASPSTGGTASIRGRIVVDDETAAPIRNARVSLTSPAGTIPTVLADGDGRFAITALAAGRYVLTAAKAGFVSRVFGTTRPGDPATPIVVADGATVDGLEIRVPRSGAITGRVVDDLGDPAAGVTVTADYVGPDMMSGHEPRSLIVAGSARTNDLGDYRIAGLVDGVFVVSINWSGGSSPAVSTIGVVIETAGGQTFIRRGDGTPGIAPARTYYPQATALRDAQPISVSRGEERSAIDFVVALNRQQGTLVRTADAARASTSADAGAIRGRTFRSNGKPLGRALIRLTNAGNLAVRVTESDDDGAYEFPRVAPDVYTLTASKAGFVDRSIARVTIEPARTREGIDLKLSGYGAIEGRLLDEYGDPLEGARVRALRVRFVGGRRRLVDDARVATGLTDDRGRYRLSLVGPGQYFVASLIGQIIATMPMADVPGYVPTYFPGTEHAADAGAVTVGVSQEVSDVDFAVKRTATARIAGVALSSTGDPIRGNLTMRASERSGAVSAIVVGARIAADGSFEFPNVAPGEYLIRTFKDRRNPWTEGEFGSLEVTVNGSDVSGLVLQSTPGSTVSGRITRDGAGTITPAAIELTPVPVDPDRSGGQAARADVHIDWSFEIAGLNGPRRLRLNGPRGWGLKTIYANGVDVTDVPLPFGTAAQSLADLEVVITDRLTEVSGAIVDKNGGAVADASVVAFSTDRERWYPDSRFVRRSSPGPRFAVTGLPAGEYFVAAIASTPAAEDGEWQDPEFLAAISRQATRLLLAEGQQIALEVKLAAP